MKSLLYCFLLLSLFSLPFRGYSQIPDANGNFILLVVPESDTTITSTTKYRLSASTRPGNTVTINGVPFNVYKSGAFAGLLDLVNDENRFEIVSKANDGTSISKSFLISKIPPMKTTRTDSLIIEDVMMKPVLDIWYNEGDIVEVQVKGTPGMKGTFLNGIPMRELSAYGSNGLRGVYHGLYKVKATDTLRNFQISVRLEDSLGKFVTKKLPGRISFMGQEFPLVGITHGDRPALNFGLGEDRLGGAKLSFLVSGIRLTITGKIGDQYRVALTENQEAWISADMVDLQPRGTFLPYSLTGNWTVYGDEKYDYVAININDKLAFSSTQESDPTRIHVDIYGAVSNSNWITQLLTTKEIKNVYYAQIEKNLLRVTIELASKHIWGYEVGYSGGTFNIKVRRQPQSLKLKNLTFVLDAGHGGTNKGALGSTGILEKDINFATMLQVKRLLENEGAKVRLTRSDDSDLSMNARVRTALASDADLLISIHSNSVGYTTNPDKVSGASTYYKHICYRPLSMAILKRLLSLDLANFGNVGGFNFLLNSPTEIPNVLVELAFMSNPGDEMKLMDEDFRKDLAKEIVKGIEDYLDSCSD